jgi:capsular exopolysaccharide synthesis family protein
MPAEVPHRQKGLFDYLRALRDNLVIIVLTVALVTGSAVGFDLLRTKKYTATATIQFISQDVAANGATTSLTPQDIVTQVALMESAAVYQKAALLLRRAPGGVTVAEVGSTETATVSVTSSSPLSAAQSANAYVHAYLALTEATFLAERQKAEEQFQNQINGLELKISGVEEQIAATKDASQITALSQQLASLQNQVNTLQGQLTQMQIAVASSPSGGRLISPATPPSSPSSPKIIRDAAIAAALGLLLGVAIALIRDHLDDDIRSHEDLELVAGDRPLLAMIPKASEWRSDRSAYLVCQQRPNSASAEAYRSLRTSILFAGLDRGLKVIEVTSSSPFEGKTTTAANLAYVMAEAGRRTLIVSCDLRKPRIHEFFNAPNNVGYTSVLMESWPLDMAILPVAGVENLWILPAGPAPSNPSELLGSRLSRELFATLRAQFDVVIIDTPPAVPVTDPSVLATIADATVVVARAGRTKKSQLETALTILDRVEAPVLGMVLNVADELDRYRSPYQYAYGEAYGYISSAPAKTAADDDEGPRQSRQERKKASKRQWGKDSEENSSDEPSATDE